jgi:cytochrome c-type biogenesis protein CcmH
MAWIPLIILALLAAAMVVPPLVSKGSAPKSRARYDLEVYRDQLRELEDDVARGLLTPAQEAAARLEIDRRVLGAAKGASYTSTATKARTGRWQIATLAALIIAAPVALYLWRGSPGTPDRPLAGRPELVRPEANSRELLKFIAARETALANSPDDPAGWILLSRAYLAAGRFDDAANAARRAIAQGRADANTYMELTEALINAGGGLVTPPALEAIAAALAADPAHAAARYYDGIAKAQSGRMREAFDIWLALVKDTPADAPYLAIVRRQLEDAARQLNINLAAVMPQPATPAPLAGMTAEQQLAMITQMVDRLAATMEQNPNDLAGWLRLAQSYRVLERWDDARNAVARAVALAPNDVGVLTEQAGVWLAATPANDPFAPEAKEILERVLELDPDNLEAMYFLGMAAAEAGETDAAAAHWGKLLTRLDPGTQAHAEVKARLDGLARGVAPRP